MKGYVTNGILYIFPQDAGEIPYVDPEVVQIAISPDELDAFKVVNEAYANIMVPYNYNTITANKKVWADHLDDDIVNPEPPVETYSLTVESTVQLDVNALKKYGGGDVDPAAIESGQQLTIDAPQGYTFNQAAAENVLQATFTGGDVTYSDLGDYVYFVMPADNATISITEATPVVTNPTLTINGEDAPGFRPSIKDGNDNTISDGDNVAEGTTITISIKSGQLDTFTFDQSNPDSKSVIYVYLDNVGLSKDAGAETITFTMPATDAELLMTESPLT